MPELTQTLCENGAEVIIYPFATPEVCGSRKNIWNKYMKARAYDNRAFVIAANLYGGIMVINPKGDKLIEEYEKDTIVIDIDVDEVYELRNSEKKNFNKRLNKKVLNKVNKYDI